MTPEPEVPTSEAAELLDEVDCDPDHTFRQDGEGHTEVAPESPDWTLDPQ